jgi:DNA repair photolyase
MKRFTGHEEPWGEFVDAKINAVEVFEKDLRIVKPGDGAFISSATDAYQPVEGHYKLTRSILEKIAKTPLDLFQNGFPVSILTKSDLILRDIDLLKCLPKVSVGFSFTTANETARRLFEPRCSPARQRFAALKTLRDAGIRTYAFIGPILPEITDLPTIFASLEGIVEYVIGETLNRCCGNLTNVLHAVSAWNHKLRPTIEQNLKSRGFWQSVEKEFYNNAKKYNIRVGGFHHHSNSYET